MQHNTPVPDWHLFTIPTWKVLEFIETTTGKTFPAAPEAKMEAQRWHMALRQGLRSHLHIDVGIPGVYSPENPVVENECALHAALLLSLPNLKVILSGQWDEALRLGLINRQQLDHHEAALEQEILQG